MTVQSQSQPAAVLSSADSSGARTLTLNRPEKSNALSAELVDTLHASLDLIGDETRLLVIHGEGRNFCAGFDFTDVEAQSEGDLLLRFVRINELLRRLRTAPYMTMAWVIGAAFGAGADIVCACAVRVGAQGMAAEHAGAMAGAASAAGAGANTNTETNSAARANKNTGAVKFRFPGFQFGIALGTRRLAALVGNDTARSILVANRVLDIAAAQQCGLLTEVATVTREQRTSELAKSIATLDAPALRTLLRLTDPGDAGNGGTDDADLADLVRTAATAGLRERIAAYRSRSA